MDTRLTRLSKKRLEFGVDFTDYAPSLQQVIEHDGSLNAGERYRDGNIAIHVHLRIRPRVGEQDAAEVCARFRKFGITENEPLDLGAGGMIDNRQERHILAQSGGHQGDGGGYRQEKMVLVLIVDEIEPTQGVREELVPSEVRLTTLDQCDLILIEAFEPTRPASFPLSGLIGNDETGVRVRVFPALLDKSPNQVVEDRAELVRKLPYQQAPFSGWLAGDAKNILAGISIEASLYGASYGLDECRHLVVDDCEVVISPVQP